MCGSAFNIVGIVNFYFFDFSANVLYSY